MKMLSTPSQIRPTHACTCLFVLVAVATANAEPAPADKSAFTLFNPTPRKLMRDLSPDRPDTTESAYTVDAGHVQLEMTFFDYVRDHDNGDHFDARAALDTNLKLGLTNDIDVQFIFAAYTVERSRPAGAATETLEGFGDVTLRVKFNLWGNDDGDARTPHGLGSTAFAIMPFIKIPTGTELSNDHVEGGIILPFAIPLSDAAGLGLMAEFDAAYDEADGDYDLEFVHTATIGFDVTGPVGAYVEYIGILGTDSSTHYQAIFSAGVTVEIIRDVLLDAGVRVGLNEAAEDLGLFTGMTIRF